MKIATVNPATNKQEKVFKELKETDVENYLELAHLEFEEYKKLPLIVRCKLMKTAGEVLLGNKQEYAELITREMGKPIAQSIAEIEKCALLCNYYATNAKSFLEDEFIETDATQSFVSYEPLGVILGIMPWNFPFWQVFRFAVPAMVAGNVCLLKHASNVPQCALAIQSIFRKAGFTENTFITMLIGPEKVKKLIKDERIKGISLTGSDEAGSLVAQLAGKHIKKTVLELGGSDPFVVLEDANVKEAAENAVISRFANAGQSCIAAKRFIVSEVIADDFIKLLKEYIQALKVGDPMDMNTDIGPLAREDLVVQLVKQVQKSVKKGAKIVLGGKRPNKKGAFFNRTILKNVCKGMPVYDEEVFGPVVSVIIVKDQEEAIRIANDTKYGLGASIWTVDVEKGTRLARKIEAGMVFVNGVVRSDPRLPFGGIKKSGYGRELSKAGILEFVNQKTIWVC